jgi:hypothetical protein
MENKWCAWEDQGVRCHGFIMCSSTTDLCIRTGHNHKLISLPPAKVTLFETPDKAKKHAQKLNRSKQAKLG